MYEENNTVDYEDTLVRLDACLLYGIVCIEPSPTSNWRYVLWMSGKDPLGNPYGRPYCMHISKSSIAIMIFPKDDKDEDDALHGG